MNRTREEWLEIFHTQTLGDPEAIADRIMADLWGYGTSSKKATDPIGEWRMSDLKTLAAALEAYAAKRVRGL
jgi:hypothetical protein